jgi:glucose-6-phosphate 1-dehydrogenase
VIDQLLLLGASGDLAGRYLLPALAHLQEAGRLPEPFAIVGVARDDWDTAAFRRHLAARLEHHAATVDPGVREAVAAMASYQRADAGDAAALAGALDQAKGPVVAYLALPPTSFVPAIGALAAVGLPEGSRVVVERPFGGSLAEARALNQFLGRCFGEEATFRADHFLGLQTVQNLLGLRFANRVFEPVWNAGHVERVEVVWDETVALEGRAGYYDHAGALRDVIQNHLLQLVCLTAMEPPAQLDPDRLHDRKVELLGAVQPPPPGQLAARTVRARYSAGRIDGVDVPAYAEEPGVDPARGTETFAEVTLEIDNPPGAECRSGCAPARPSPTSVPRSSSTSGPPASQPSRRRPRSPPTCSGSASTPTA